MLNILSPSDTTLMTEISQLLWQLTTTIHRIYCTAYEHTVLCFLCSSSAYLVTSFTSSVTFCTICKWRVESFSDDVRSTCQKGANVPCTHPPAACFASLVKSFEWFSSTLDLEQYISLSKGTGGTMELNHQKGNYAEWLSQYHNWTSQSQHLENQDKNSLTRGVLFATKSEDWFWSPSSIFWDVIHNHWVNEFWHFERQVTASSSLTQSTMLVQNTASHSHSPTS